MSRSAIAIVVAVSFGFASTPTHAQDDDGDAAAAQVRQAYQEVDYGRCRDRAQAALLKPASGTARVDVYRFLGLCEAALGNTDEARDAFSRMLAIDRDAKLPEGLSPRFTSSYREAKGQWAGQVALGLALESERIDGKTRTVRLKLTDLAGLAAKVSWRGESGARAPAVRAAPRLELEVPAEVAVDVFALDKAGGEIATLHLPSAAPKQAPVAASKVPLDEAPPQAEEGIGALGVWLIVGGAVVVAAGVAAGVAYAVLPPQQVALKSNVVFGSE